VRYAMQGGRLTANGTLGALFQFSYLFKGNKTDGVLSTGQSNGQDSMIDPPYLYESMFIDHRRITFELFTFVSDPCLGSQSGGVNVPSDPQSV
jgi:hypothetical protein